MKPQIQTNRNFIMNMTTLKSKIRMLSLCKRRVAASLDFQMTLSIDRCIMKKSSQVLRLRIVYCLMRRLSSQYRMDIISIGKHTTKMSMKQREILTKERANAIHSPAMRLTRSRNSMKALQSTSSLLPKSQKEAEKNEAKRAVGKTAGKKGVSQSVSKTTKQGRIDVTKQRKIVARRLRKIGTTNRSP